MLVTVSSEQNNLIIAYESKTGNVEKFVNKLKAELPGFVFHSIKSENTDRLIDKKCVLITFTTGYGKIPEDTIKFINTNHANIISVSSSGNRNWGTNYAVAADKIAKKMNIPVGLKFELSGNKIDVDKFVKHINLLKS
jgi:protein involved in ribonucleotide reduction